MIRRLRFLEQPHWVLAFLLTAHGWLVIDAARRQSPPWDEIISPAVGLAQWRTGEIGINTAHPFLSKLICSVPLLFTSAELPLEHSSWRNKDQFRFGFQFTFRGTLDPKKIIFWSRIPSLILSMGMCLMGFRWGRSLWGPKGGFICLLCLSMSPILLSRASLALLEMPLYFFLTLTLVFWTDWRRAGQRRAYVFGTVAAGCALACKSASAPFLAALVLAEFAAQKPGRTLRRRTGDALGFVFLTALTVLLLYLPWKGGWAALKTAWLFPLNFGDVHNQFFFAGTLYQNASPILTWAALALKAPLFIWALALWGGLLWYRSGLERDVWRGLSFMVGITLFSFLGTGSALSTVQLSPLYIGLGALASGIACQKWDAKKAALAALLLLGAAVEIGRAHPNQTAFFNFLAGGPSQGYRWLADSDQDWGQSLPELHRYLEKEGNPGIILCYSGPADPEAYGILYQDLISPALVSRGRTNRLLPVHGEKVFLAVGAKVLQTEPNALHWLMGNVPRRTLVDSCFHVYDVSLDSAIFQRMANLYHQMGREPEAQWAAEKARWLNSVAPNRP
ncbi:MAG: glycosyltransferase family 39 protein [Elusimicrobia bacterium]|nr:glycosyltransferase family 39 protein [Elusimicrobiota bacterium]